MGDTTAEAERHVISNLQALYAQTSPALAKEADKWLKDFQLVSPLAWTTSDRILHNTALPYEVHFYAASTLYIKIQYLASIDLTPESRLALRDSLISHISTHSKGMEPLRSKLAQSIAVLALHMATEWPNVVNDLVATLTRTPDLVPALFSVMEILPEESENYHSTSRVSKESVAAFRAQIRSAAPGIIRNFGNPALIGNSKDANVQSQIMRCFGNWLRVCEDSQVPNALSNNQLVISVFDALNNTDLFDAALSAVCELVLVSTQGELRQLMEYAVNRAQSYLPAFKTAVKDEDEETFKGLCHLFTEMAETYLPVILVGDSTVLPLVEVMLECVAHTEVEVAAITFRFWQLLAEGLAKSERKDIVAWFATTIFPRLFEHLYRLTCYPDDYATWPNDLQEDFREVRKTEVTTTLRTTCSIMEASACFAKLASILEKQLAPTGYATTGNWRLLEGAMYCMRALARCVDTKPGADPMVGSILKIVPQLPNHKEIHYTSLLIVGRYADWLKTDPSLLWPLFSYVVVALGHSDTAPSAAVSFKNICGSCAKLIAETHLQDILQIATNSMQANQLHVTDHVEVLDGVAQVISTLPFDSCVTSLQTLCLPLLNSIRTHTPKSDIKSTQLADSLCKLATLFLCTQTFRRNPDRTAPIVEAIWPILEPVFTTHASDSAVIDQLFRCIRYLLDSFPTSFEPSPTSTILPSLFSLMKSTFRISRNPAILYTASAFIKYNSQKPYHIPLLWDLLLDFSHTVLKVPTDAVAEAELAGEYCMLMEHAAHDLAAQIRATAGLAEGIVAWCGAALCQIAQLSRQDRHQREAFYSICRLLSVMIQEGQDFTSTGEGLMRALFSCMALCGISLSRASCLCEIMRRLVTQAPAHASAWVSAADATLPAALPHATKTKFLTALAEAAKYPITESGRPEKGNSKTNGVSANGMANGHAHLAEDAERNLVNSAMDLADMCKKFSRT